MICRFVCVLLCLQKSWSIALDVMSKIISEATVIGPADTLAKKRKNSVFSLETATSLHFW